MSVLVLNAGSSTIKYGCFDFDTLAMLDSGVLEKQEGRDEKAVVADILGRLSQKITAVGHRVVHGGTRFQKSVRIDDHAKKELDAFSKLAPLHNPPALTLIEAARGALGNVPHVAVFDTAFFSHLPLKEIVYPLPYAWYAEWGIRRFGFHGLSHASVARRASDLMEKPLSQLNLLTCHLGNGCSAAAVEKGKAKATTMGFTPLEGMMMGTRSGSIDPGILFYLEKERGLNKDVLGNALNHQSGLLGVSGLSADYRDVEKAAREGHARAKLALEMYADRVQESVAALSTKLDTLDALVFTGGVGENARALRSAVVGGLRQLGLVLDPEKNKSARADAAISAAHSKAAIFVIHTEEEREIAEAARNWVRESDGVRS